MVLGISPSLYFFIGETEWRLKDMMNWIECGKCKERILPMHPDAQFDVDPVIYCEDCWKQVEAPAPADAKGGE